MRNLNADLLSQRFGLEPTLIVGIKWGGTSVNETLYYDKNNGLDKPGKILDIAGIEDVTQFDGGGSNSSVNIKLDDTDSTIKAIFDKTDVHKVPVTIYQAFIQGGALAGMIPIYEGQINTPIVWSESDRTFDFSAVTKIEDLEVGFSADAGQFPNLPDAYVGKVWPLAFGHVKRVPGLTFQTVPIGSTFENIVAVDRMLDLVLQGVIQPRLDNLQQQLNLAFFYQAVAAFNQDDSAEQGFRQQTIDIQEQMNQYRHDLQEQLLSIQNFQRQFDVDLQAAEKNLSGPIIIDDSGGLGDAAPATHVTLINKGYLFPVNTPMILQVGPWKAHGTMDAKGVVRLKWIRPPLPESLHYIDQTDFSFHTEYLVPLWTDADIYVTPDNKIAPIFKGDTGIGPNKESIPPGFGLTSSINPEQMTIIPAGSTVKIIGDINIDFIINIIPTTVTQVWAYKAVDNIRMIHPVPQAYWKHIQVHYGTLTAEVVRLKRPLSGYAFENWEDEIFVDQISSVGPNTVDIMKWLIQQYTTHTFDAESFNSVHADLALYPSNFFLDKRGNILAVLAEMAYQCRCAIWLKNGVFFLKYLPKEVDAVATITEDDIEVNTMQISCTPTEQIVTKIVATYTSDYSIDNGTDIITVKNNDSIYGLITESDDYYIYTDSTLVQKSVTYWMIKKSTTFKKIQFSCFLNMLNLETFDTVLLNFTHPWVATDPVKALVESANYNSAENKIDMVCWVPVRFGEMKVFDLAWPKAASIASFFPLVLAQGSATSKPQFFKGDISGLLPTIIGGGTQPQVDPPGSRKKLVERAHTDLGEFLPTDANDIPFVFADETIATSSANLVETPTYNFDDLNEAENPKKEITKVPASTFPGQVLSKVTASGGHDNDYTVVIYKNGIDGKGSPVVATQLFMNKDDTIPPNTWTMVSVTAIPKTDTKPARNEYTMQVPIWL